VASVLDIACSTGELCFDLYRQRHSKSFLNGEELRNLFKESGLPFDVEYSMVFWCGDCRVTVISGKR